MRQDAQVMRSAYFAMDLVGRYLIVPLSFASLVSVIDQGLGAPWGLFRRYWVQPHSGAQAMEPDPIRPPPAVWRQQGNRYFCRAIQPKFVSSLCMKAAFTTERLGRS